MLDLLDSRKTPRVPRAVRDRARSVLRHYPGPFDMQRVAAARPDIFQERMEDLHRFVSAGAQQRAAEFNPEVAQPHREQD